MQQSESGDQPMEVGGGTRQVGITNSVDCAKREDEERKRIFDKQAKDREEARKAREARELAAKQRYEAEARKKADMQRLVREEVEQQKRDQAMRDHKAKMAEVDRQLAEK